MILNADVDYFCFKVELNLVNTTSSITALLHTFSLVVLALFGII